MKSLLTLSLILLSSYCWAQDTPATPHRKKVKFFKIKLPEGMKYVPSGSFKMQRLGIEGAANTPDVQTLQMVGFYMDATEVTNLEYRQFINWVRDSIGNILLGNIKTMADGSQKLDMKKIDWNDPATQQRLSALYLPGNDWGSKRIDVGKLIYHYQVFDYKASVLHPDAVQIKYVTNLDVPVYPNTTVFASKSAAAVNEPVALQYFWFRGFNNYPVVGVSLQQAKAFCDWRTRTWKAEHQDEQNVAEVSFRLPTEAEWEWAARGGDPDVTPFTNPPLLSIGFADGIMKAQDSRNGSNAYGLKNMDGNVSEWTASELGPKRVVRGGNWDHAPKDQQTNVRFLQNAESSTFYVGFRCVFSEVYKEAKLTK